MVKFTLYILFLSALLIQKSYEDAVEDGVEEGVSQGVSEEISEEESEKSVPVETVISEEEELKFAEMKKTSITETYQTEVTQMMKIFINNLYGKKEVFLRELISNSFDALDKVRIASLQKPSILEANQAQDIKIRFDPVNHILTVTDSGIGMTREELITNLGTIAKSGTREFMNKLAKEGSTSDISSQIGQFGVGFYSVFLVADKVLVASKSVDDPVQHIFEADTAGFNVYDDPRGDTLGRGTSVILYLNKESHEFLKEDRIIGLIRKYSEFIQFPIYIYSNRDDDNKEVPSYWKHVNDISPIWMRSPNEITQEEYNSFYNSVAYGRKKEKYSKPTGVIHFVAEGETTFRALIFIPDKLDDDYVNNPVGFRPKLRLYVRRVLITADTRGFLPQYLSYVVGVIDSEDLPLNVGREMLQHAEIIRVLKKKLTRKVLDHIKRLAQDDEEKYLEFYEEFGNTLKFGIIDDESNSNRIAKLLRYYSSASTDKKITFDDYVSRMKPDQPGILFISAATIEEAKKSPYMERIRLKGYEVLYMLDTIDEAIMQNLRVYDNKAIYNIAKEVTDMPQSKSEEERQKEKEAEYKPLLTWLKKSYFKGRISSARVSSRLLTSSCILLAPEQGYSGNMDRMIRSQANIHGKFSGYDQVLNQPKNLELNPHHPLVKSMLEQVENDPDSPALKEDAEVCFSIATLSGGYSMNDGVQLAQLIEKLYLKGHNLNAEDISRQIHDELGLEEEEKEEQPPKEDDDSDDTSDDTESFGDLNQNQNMPNPELAHEEL